MFNFLKRNYFAISLTIALVTLVVMVFSHSRKDYDYILGNFFQSVTYPIISLANTASDNLLGVFTGYIWLIGVQKENLALQQTVKQLKTENSDLINQLTDYQNLKSSYELYSAEAPTRLYAKVVSEVNNNYSKLLVINRGADDGVQKNQGVVSYRGIVGKIIRVNKNHSLVQLITDAQSKIPGIIKKNLNRALIQGDGENYLLLKVLPREEKIEVGDEIITSNVISIFPSGYKVGEVISVYQKEFGWFQEAKVKPAVALDKIENVFIVKDTRSDEILELIKSLDFSND